MFFAARLTPARRLALGMLLLLVQLPAGSSANTKAGTPIWFAETGHTLAYVFREFFDKHGGLATFGYPLTEVFAEDGRPVQYFERARMEWHADLQLVQAGHLGRWAATQQHNHPAFQSVAFPRSPDRDFFVETGHTLTGEFRRYWSAHGGLLVFGFPLSEEFVERNTEDGRDYTVQYFERARFELRPDLPAPHRVSLGHLGRQYLSANVPPTWATEPVENANAAWAAFRPTRLTLERLGIDTEISEAGFSLGKWDVPRYTAAHYWPLAAYPATTGNIIIAGHVSYKDTIFNHLPAVQTGDRITVFVGDQPHHYVVREVLTVSPQDTWVMLPTSQETLTLITCVPPGTYTQRLIVRAEPESS
ncbi:MAG: sortase [Chloroflexota bacterium]|nr:sortase [Chloroflexota bacterium]